MIDDFQKMSVITKSTQVTLPFVNCITTEEMSILEAHIEKIIFALINNKAKFRKSEISDYASWIEELLYKLNFIIEVSTLAESAVRHQTNIEADILKIGHYKQDIVNASNSAITILNGYEPKEEEPEPEPEPKPKQEPVPTKQFYVAATCKIVNGEKVITSRTYFV